MGMGVVALAAGPGVSGFGAPPPRADPAAVLLLKDAYSRREHWGPEFPGFRADIAVQIGAESGKGTVEVKPRGPNQVRVTLENAKLRRWATEALGSIVAHRQAGDFKSNDGRYPLTLGPEDHHPMGRLLKLNDGMGSSYRLKDGLLMQINRQAGPQMRFTIDMLDYRRTQHNKWLPHLFTVSFFAAKGGALLRHDTYEDTYRLVGDYYLPNERRQLTAEDGRTTMHVLSLSRQKLLP